MGRWCLDGEGTGIMTEATIFMAALEKPTETERDAFLADACAGDERLRRRVLALLRAHAEPDELLDPTLNRPEGPDARRRSRREGRAGRGLGRRPIQAAGGDRRRGDGHSLDGRAARAGQAAGRPQADQAGDGLEGRSWRGSRPSGRRWR